MKAVDRLANDRGLGQEVGIWVCTFANCQFGQDFGKKLQDWVVSCWAHSDMVNTCQGSLSLVRKESAQRSTGGFWF
eukprot:3015854-Amphidinium_carterae.1